MGLSFQKSVALKTHELILKIHKVDSKLFWWEINYSEKTATHTVSEICLKKGVRTPIHSVSEKEGYLLKHSGAGTKFEKF